MACVVLRLSFKHLLPNGNHHTLHPTLPNCQSDWQGLSVSQQVCIPTLSLSPIPKNLQFRINPFPIINYLTTGQVLCYHLSMETTTENLRIDLTAPDPRSTVNRSELARVLKIDVSMTSRVLTGQRTPRLTTFKKMADYFGVSMDELFVLLKIDGHK